MLKIHAQPAFVLAAIAFLIATFFSLHFFNAPAAADPSLQNADNSEADIYVGRLTYATDKTSTCFSPGFLQVADRETSLDIHRRFRDVPLSAPEQLHAHPFVVMSGEGSFSATASDAAALRDYLRRGGFILASADCSDANWDTSFRRLLSAALPEHKLRPLAADSDVFQMLYQIPSFQTVKQVDQPILGLYLSDRLVGIYSPTGLNDAANLGADCCCCGANELRNARQINASILLYVVTHP